MESTPLSCLPRAKRFWFSRILRSYWKTFAVALLAVLGETVADVLEPWPIKVTIDNVVQAKSLTGRWGAFVSGLFGDDRFAILYFALAAVVAIALVGAVSSYVEKYSTTSISQWVAHDLRRLLYQRIQRLSLAEHNEARVGDLLTHVTSDINAVQDFIDSALLGIIVNVLLLIRLFQPATSCSVRVWRARHFRRICANFSVNSQQRTPANSISLRAAGRTGSAVHDVDTDEPT